MSNEDLFAIDSDVQAEEDRVVTSKPRTVDTGVYPLKVDMAYLDETSGGAYQLVLTVSEDPFNGFKFTEYFTLTSGKAKGRHNYYIDAKKVKRLLPGMAQADALFQLVLGKHLNQVKPEEKVIKLWNWEAKKELPVKKQVFTDLLGKSVKGAVKRRIENKRVKNADGEWVAGPDKREFNYVDKFFTEEGLTLTEKKAGATEPKFMENWKAKFDGLTEDKFNPNIKKEDVAMPAVEDTPLLFDD